MCGAQQEDSWVHDGDRFGIMVAGCIVIDFWEGAVIPGWSCLVWIEREAGEAALWHFCSQEGDDVVMQLARKT